ncbi:hypothetical protein CR513_53837, partial [Mucuna pruriens]
MLCVQETKMENINRKVCSAIWVGEDFEWSFKPLEGRLGVCLEIFLWEITATWELYIRWWGKAKTKCTIVNVYASYDRTKKGSCGKRS